MEESLNPTVNIGPISFDLTLLAMSLVTVLMVFAFVYWASRKMTIRPKGKQNALEMIYDFVVSLQTKHWRFIHQGLFLVPIFSILVYLGCQ